MNEYSEEDILNRQLIAEKRKLLRENDDMIDDELDNGNDLDCEDVKGKVSAWV